MRILGSNEAAPHTYVAGQRVELWCQLSSAKAPVRWYKDGEEVEEGESLVLEREGPRCCLVLPCARPQDTGEFVCDVGGDSVFYSIRVAGGCPFLPLLPFALTACPAASSQDAASQLGGLLHPFWDRAMPLQRLCV